MLGVPTPTKNTAANPPATRKDLLKAVIERRTARVIFDAGRSTSLEGEIEHLLRHNKPLEGISLAGLLREWDSLIEVEDAPGYEVPVLNLDALRTEAAGKR